MQSCSSAVFLLAEVHAVIDMLKVVVSSANETKKLPTRLLSKPQLFLII
jgi:hypothetical protein